MTGTRATGRRASRRLAAVALAVVATLGVLSLTGASAATLGVTATKGLLDTTSRCTPTPVTVTPTTSGTQTTGVTVTGLTAGDVSSCQGRTATVRLVDASGRQLALQQGLPVSGSIVVSGLALTTANVAAALVDVAGFALPTAWSVPQPPAVGCYFVDPSGNRVEGCTVLQHDQYGVSTVGGVRVLDVGLRTSSTLGGDLTGWTIRFTYTLPTLVNGQPWSWATSGVVYVQEAGTSVTSPCSALPSVSISDTNAYRNTFHIKIAEDVGAYLAANGGSASCSR